MKKELVLNQAEQRIGFMYSFLENPDRLCDEDWKIWRPLIARACVQVKSENVRKKGFEAMRFFDFYFYEKLQQL